MNDRVPETPLRRSLARQHRAVRNLLMTRHVLRGAAFACAAVAVAVALGVLLPTGPGGAWTRLVLTLAAIGVAVTGAVIAFRRVAPTLDRWLEDIEGRFPELRSWLRNALEFEKDTPRDTSPALARAVADETVRRVEHVALQAGRPRVAPRRPLFILIGAVALIVVLALALPGRTSRSWATLWDPNAAAPPIRLEVAPGSVRLTPGAALAVRARVWGSPRAPRLLREGSPAVTATAEGPGSRGERVWRFDLTQLTREQDYRVRVASVESPRYRISLAGEPVPVSFDVEYHAPAYARLPLQRGTATRGDLNALRGTRARLLVTFDRDLQSLTATLPDGRSARWTAVTPRRWQGEVPIEREGEYALNAVADRGEGKFRYRITPMPDAPPLLSVRLPSGDVDLPAGQQIPVEILAQDDLGLAQLKLQYRKDPQAAWTDLPIARFGGQPREAHVETRWDATSLALLPGESAAFRFELLDDNAVSGPGRAVSPTFQLRFPSLADLYDHMDQKQQTAQSALEQIAEKAKELQKSLDKLARQQPRPQPQSSQGFERSEELKSSLERQQELSQKLDDASKQMRESLEQAAERQAFDEQLTRKLKELSELVDQVQSKEFREAIKKMQDALESMDKKALENNLPEWRKQNQEMLSNLQRTVDLIKKLRDEEKMQALASRAEELKAQQDALNQQLEKPESGKDNKDGKDSKDGKDGEKTDPKGDEKGQQESEKSKDGLAQQQQEAAKESEQLAKDAQEAKEQSKQEDEKQSLEEASKELQSEAAPSQRQAADEQKNNNKSQASKSGKKASESLQRAASGLRKMVQQMQQDQNDVDLAAVRRAAQDLLSLQRSTELNMDPNSPIQSRADRQTDLSEGTSRVADSLKILASKTPFISPKLAAALDKAVDQLTVSGRELTGGNRGRGEDAGRQGGQALNEAVIELRASEDAMCQKPGPGQSGANPKPGGANQRGQSMQQLSKRQGELNSQTRSLSERLSKQMRLQAGDQGEVERMAQEQQRIREQLEDIKRDEQAHQELLGRLDQTQREMKEVEEALRNGVTDPSIEEKQTRILSRMLDATRSINRRDFDPERESRPGVDVERASPSQLPPELLRESDRLRLDLLKAEADRYPAQYRAFIETYLRSLNGSPR